MKYLFAWEQKTANTNNGTEKNEKYIITDHVVHNLFKKYKNEYIFSYP